MLRRLRIIAATVCFASAITLVAWMVRSYRSIDYVSFMLPRTYPRSLFVRSAGGSVSMFWKTWSSGTENRWIAINDPALTTEMIWGYDELIMGKSAFRKNLGSVPLVTLAATFSAAGLLLINGRAAFSLRTALLATTALAVLLAIHVALQRAFG